MAIVNHLHTQAAAGGDGVLRHLHPRGKGRRPGQGGHRPLLPGGDPGGQGGLLQRRQGALPTWGAMQDSFPHALELSRRGYNAFALLYRPGAQTACEDLAWAITFVSDHAQELQVDLEGYSLWGGSAGGRMAAWLGPMVWRPSAGATCPGPGR